MVDYTFIYLIQVFCSLGLVALLYGSIYSGVWNRMPGGLFEHGLGILLLLIPAVGPWWVRISIIILLYVPGIILYIDDAYQHWRQVREPSYKSPLHLWGWWELRPWLNRTFGLKIGEE